MKKNNNIIGTAEAAKIFGVTQQTIRNWAGNGELPAINYDIYAKRVFIHMKFDIDLLREIKRRYEKSSL